MLSWDEASASMASVDLLSATSGDQGDALSPNHLEEMEQIEETTTAVGDGAPKGSAAPSEFVQLDFDVEHVGKKRPQSKRVAIWKYGVSGGGGHEAKLTWSTHSGKYTIAVDGEDIFQSVAKGSVLEHKWKWSHSKACVVEDDDGDGTAMRIIACRKPPISRRSSKDFRCYEFVLGGRVFRDLPVDSASGSPGNDFQNEERLHEEGKLMSILDVIEPGWRSTGFA
ncbi:hypothetical protein ACHAXT_003144 [Thalassiosira profunda]